MGPLDQDDVIQVLKIIEESTFDELRLEMDGLKLTVSKGKKGLSLDREQKHDSPDPISTDVTGESTVSAEQKESPISAPSQVEGSGLVAIKAPMLGTFYQAPKPGAPPFVGVGQSVNEDDTVCIIEVMKLFNTVKAGFRGRIAEVCAENGQMVEYQETLFLLEEAEKEEGSGEGYSS